jgi:hypothetical protein
MHVWTDAERKIVTATSSDTPIVAEIRGGVKRYAGVLALDHVDFTIRAGGPARIGAK